MSVWAVILAAGAGDRFGGPKQWFEIAGRPVVDWAVSQARPAVDGIVVVAPLHCGGADLTVGGGHSRLQSVRAGLAVVPVDADVIVIHDAARPAATTALWARVVDVVRCGAPCAIPAVPVVDALRDDGCLPVPRGGLMQIQTPQAFRAGLIRQIHADEPESVDDASLVAPRLVHLVPGERGNVKLTERGDLPVLEALLEARSVAGAVRS